MKVHVRSFAMPIPASSRGRTLSQALDIIWPALIALCPVLYHSVMSTSLRVGPQPDCSLDYMDYSSPPGPSVHGDSPVFSRILEWLATPTYRGSSQSRDQTQVSCIAGRFFTV